jgi:hypothetical protein
MSFFTARLEARDPARDCFRSYRLEAGPDLFGAWLVGATYGRIGSRGRTVRHVADDQAQARKIVRHCLQRRATAPRRIGCPTSSASCTTPPNGYSRAPRHPGGRVLHDSLTARSPRTATASGILPPAGAGRESATGTPGRGVPEIWQRSETNWAIGRHSRRQEGEGEFALP